MARIRESQPGQVRDPSSSAAQSARRRRAVHPREWMYLRQHHGSGVIVARDLTARGDDGDALVTDQTGLTLAVLWADCAPVALASSQGIIAAVHAGRKGLSAGVVQATVEHMLCMGATEIKAALGPCIHVECYEFGEEPLALLAKQFGETVVGETAHGKPAFDLPTAVGVALEQVGVPLVHTEAACTACNTEYFSYRASTDDRSNRQVMLVWRED